MDEKAFVIERTERIARDMIYIRDRLFAYAELPYREVRSAELLEKVLRQYGFTVSAPYRGASFDLIAGEYTAMPEGVPVPETKVKARQSRAQDAFDALVAACDRLMAVIRGCKGIPNKELSRFTGQVNSLADKWSSWTTRT